MFTQTKKIKCPHCGWIRTVQIDVDAAGAIVVRGLGDKLQAAMDKLREHLSDPALEAANAWIDMQDCPKCGNVYRYNTITGETKP